MLKHILTRIRPLIAPVVVLAACLGAISILRKQGVRPNPIQLMQSEMNRQFDMFQMALAQSNTVQLEMQRRMLQAEKLRRELAEQFERSQRELIETQRALQRANENLLASQQALRRVQDDIEQLRLAKTKNPIPSPDPTPVTEQVDEMAIVSEKIQALKKIRDDNQEIAHAVSESLQYFDRLWDDYTATGNALMLARTRLITNRLRSLELVQRPAISTSTDRRPDFGAEIAIAGVGQDEIPRISPGLLRLWIAERINERSEETIKLQRRLTAVNSAIEEVQRELVVRQKALEKVEAELVHRTGNP